jgi:hypothetical protein
MRTLSMLLAIFALASTTRADLLEPADTQAGYIALLLINETPFPGERGWVSEADTKAAMLAILWVLHSRIDHVPPGYRQEHIAAVRSRDIIDVITVGGVRGQCDGFYKDDDGRFVAVTRVHDRVEHLVAVASRGEPGRFTRLLTYAQDLARGYSKAGPTGADRYLALRRIGDVDVTGRAYSWMTNLDMYSPGGDFVRIPDVDDGAVGGNRFFTLRKRQ